MELSSNEANEEKLRTFHKSRWKRNNWCYIIVRTKRKKLPKQMIPRSSTEERPVERGDSCLSEHSLKQRIGARALNNSKDPKKGVWITAQKKIVYFQEYTIAVIIECIQSVKINTYTVFHNKRNIHPLFFCSFLCRCCFFFTSKTSSHLEYASITITNICR